MNTNHVPATLVRAQEKLVRLRVVCLTVLCWELIALHFLRTGFGLRLSIIVTALVAVVFIFWPSIIGTALLAGTRTAHFAGASQRLFARWRDNRFHFGLRTVFVLLAACAVIACVSRLLYDQAYPKAYMTGRVVFQGTGRPASGVLVRAQSTVQSMIRGKPHGFAEVRTDRHGRYRLPMLPAAEYNIWAEKEGWTCVAVDSFGPPPNRLATAPDIPLISGGWIVGRVVNAKTGRPVTVIPGSGDSPYNVLVETGGNAAAHIGLYGPSRPESGAAIAWAPIEDDGSFRIRAAPGENFIYVMIETGRDFELPNAMRLDVQEGQTKVVELKVMP